MPGFLHHTYSTVQQERYLQMSDTQLCLLVLHYHVQCIRALLAMADGDDDDDDNDNDHGHDDDDHYDDDDHDHDKKY